MFGNRPSSVRMYFTSKVSVRTLRHMNRIKVNGLAVRVLNQWSTGPGAEPHTYRVISNGFKAHVFSVGSAGAGLWRLQIDGTAPVVCVVERVSS